jgi:hypothetical protein
MKRNHIISNDVLRDIFMCQMEGEVGGFAANLTLLEMKATNIEINYEQIISLGNCEVIDLHFSSV